MPVKKTIDLQWWASECIEDYLSDYLFVTGGYGIGKTFSGVLWSLDRAKKNPNTEILNIMPKYSLIQDVLIPTYRDVLNIFGRIEGKHYTINKSELKIDLGNGNVIHFLTGEKPEKIVGFNRVAFAWLDESALMVRQVYDNAVARCRFVGSNTKPQMLMSSTPEGLNWFSEEADSDAQSGWDKSEDKDHTKTDMIELEGEQIEIKKRRFRATTFSNKQNLAQTYIPSLLKAYQHNANKVDSYVYGFFRPFTSGMAYSNFKYGIHIKKPMPAEPYFDIHLSWDFNICPQWVVVQTYYESDEHTGKRKRFNYVIDEANSNGETLEDAVVEFIVKFPLKDFQDTPIYIYGDSSGRARSHKGNGASDYDNIIGILKEAGYNKISLRAIKSNPLERVSVDLVQKLFFQDELFICDNCPNVIRSVTNTVWKNGQRQKLDKPSNDTWTHPMDSLKYYVCAVYDNKNHFIGNYGR